jgi:hypothetical protein
MSNFNLYLEKVIKEKEILNEFVIDKTQETILNKILDIKYTHEMIEKIIKKITDEDFVNIKSKKDKKDIINYFNKKENIDKEDLVIIVILAISGILNKKNVEEIKNQYNKLCEIFNNSKIHFQSKNDQKFRKEILTVIKNGDTNYYKNYDLGTLMSTKEFKNEGKNINSEFRKVSV